MIESDRAQRYRVIVAAAALALVFLAGFTAGQLTPTASASVALQSTATDSYLARFDEIWQLVHREYVEQPIDDERLIQGAIQGMLEELDDPHTSYMPPGEFELFNEDLSGNYSGIGVQVEAQGERLLVVSPFDGSPAKEAGLQPGDQIVQVDDTLISEFDDPLAAITLVRGPAGEPVTLHLLRGEERLVVTIVRATIPLISASGEILEGGIGYIRIADFGYTTASQLRETMSVLMAQAPSGLVLDLRGNPGGSLDAALQVTSEFIGEGIIMREAWGDGREREYAAYPGGLATDSSVPLIVLVDGGSASASEIVAGAIQDRGRGQLLGDQTFGKGTVQSWHDLGADRGGVRITIARWLTPANRWIHEQGLEPDILLQLTPAEQSGGRDITLDSAVNHLLGRPLPTRASRFAIDAPHWIVPLP